MMRMRMLLVGMTILWVLSGCYYRTGTGNSQTAVQTTVAEKEEEREENSYVVREKTDFSFLNMPVRFVKEEGAVLLSREDDYLTKLSEFDWMSKFKSEEPLDEEDLLKIYQDELLSWEDSEVEKIMEALAAVEPMVAAYTFDMPKELWFINETGTIEGGAAYTRGNAIVLPRDFLAATDGESLEELLLHEFFHVISRYNKNLRPDLYGIIHYKPCEPLVLTGELAERTIANPDAPDLNYYIECTYEDNLMAFIPILYSERDYSLEADDSFFGLLKDDMLAVTLEDQVPAPVMKEDGTALIVKKEDLSEYYQLIGTNTYYTYHPEETMADNFVLMVLNKDDQVPNPEILEAMRGIFTKE